MMIVIHHHLTTASKPAAKHAKPSSLKYADTTNTKTDLNVFIYLFTYIFHRERMWGRGGDQEGMGGEGGLKMFSNGDE